MEIIKKYKPVIIVENWNDYEYKQLLDLGYVKHVEKENTIFVFSNNDIRLKNHIDLLQIGSNVGDLKNDPFFNQIKTENNCIFVEPIPRYYNELVKNYEKKCPNNKFIFLNRAVSSNNDKITIYYPSEENDFDKLPWWITQLGSINKEHVKNHGYEVDLNELKTTPITLNQIIEKYKIDSIEILHIDTEGHDYDILMSFDFKIQPKYIQFEHLHMDGYSTTGKKYEQLLHHIISKGYEIFKKNSDDTILKLKC
jgi:FkbM family methyltransferase